MEVHFNPEALNDLIPLLQDIAKRRMLRVDDVYAVADQTGKLLGVDDLEKLLQEQIKARLDEGFGYAFDEDCVEALAGIFEKECKPIMDEVLSFALGEISGENLNDALYEIFLESRLPLQNVLQKSLGIPDWAADFISKKLGDYTLSVYCFAAAYKIYCKAAEDAQLAHDRRVEIEKMANEAIAGLTAQRRAMEQMVDEYMLNKLLPFSEGISAMDRAIIENDDDGFIAANATLWELFGYQAQYSNAAEFDELMMSEETFKL